MKHIERLKDIKEFRDEDGNVAARKGTTCDLLELKQQRYVKKQWHSGDWVFPEEYEYAIEKHVYMTGNELGLPIPRMAEYNDEDRSLLIEYVKGEYIETPCSDKSLLSSIVSFQDVFRNIGFPSSNSPRVMDGVEIHEYRLEQLKYIFGVGSLCERVDSIYESFLRDIDYVTIPFDRILHNTLLTDAGLRFFDFEWSILGPYEFALARIAVEFNTYSNPMIWDRIESENLYMLFLIRFYLYGRETETLGPYLRDRIQNEELRSLIEIIDEHKRTKYAKL